MLNKIVPQNQTYYRISKDNINRKVENDFSKSDTNFSQLLNFLGNINQATITVQNSSEKPSEKEIEELKNELKSYTIKDSYSDRQIKRFEDNEIESLVKHVTTKNKLKLIKYFIEQNYEDTDKTTLPRYDSYDIAHLLELEDIEKYLGIVKLLSDITITTIRGHIRPKFDSDDIEALIPVAKNKNNIHLIDLFVKEYEYSTRKIVAILSKLNTEEKSAYANEKIKNKDSRSLIERINKASIDDDIKTTLIVQILGLNVNDNTNLSLREKEEKIRQLQRSLDNKTISDEDKKALKIKETIKNLQNSISSVIRIVDIPQSSKVNMFREFFANNSQELEKILKNADFRQYKKDGLPLKYSRGEFLSDLSNLFENLDNATKEKIVQKLDIKIITEDGKITGYDGIINLEKLDKNNEIENSVLKLARKFILENEIITGDKKLDKTLNSLISGMPEFINIIGKKQHSTHSYSLDIHILTVLNEAMNNEKYDDLSNIDKTCLKLACVIHDIGKMESIKDDNHATVSALYARDILRRYNLPKNIKDRVFELIKNHHWLEKYNKKKISSSDVAILFRRTNDLKLARIMADADLKSVDDGFFYRIYKNALNAEFQEPIDKTLQEINKTGQMFLTSKLIDKSKVPTQNINGINYPIIDFTKLSEDFDLSQYGFEKGTTKDNLRLFIHTVRNNSLENLENVYALSDTSYEGLLSSSYISLANISTYGKNKFGVSLEVENANIANAYFETQTSGCSKNFNSFKKLSSDKEFIKYREMIAKAIQEELHITEEEYSELYSQIQKFSSINQLKSVKEIKLGNRILNSDKIIKAIRKANEEVITINGTSEYNEATLYSPQVQAIIAKLNNDEELPKELLDYSKKYDLPIYILSRE